MNERPILFSGEMVRAILDGRKTQTRRVINKRGFLGDFPGYINGARLLLFDGWRAIFKKGGYPQVDAMCPYGQVGAHLWVRETWGVPGVLDNERPSKFWKWGVWYRADGTYATLETHGPPFGTRYSDSARGKWRPSIFMPRWASRITLEVLGVRVERVQDIGVDGIRAEGVEVLEGWDSDDVIVAKWIELWDSINAKRGYGWDMNPWVWVVEFQQVTQ